MNRVSLLWALALSPLCGQPLGQHDRDFALSHLHAALSEDFVFRRVQALLKSSPASGRKAAVNEQEILNRMTDRSQKAKNSAATDPGGRWATPAQLSQCFKERRSQTLDYVRTTQDALRSHLDGAGAGALDACQWLLIAGHTARHLARINEIKPDPRFPK